MSRFDLSLDDLAALMPGEPAFRARQVWRGLHHGREPKELTDLPRALRARLGADLPAGLSLRQESVSDGGDTVKWLWGLADGAAIETVLLRYPDRSTVCISSQAGCAMACSFCATGQSGFTRHLTTGEIVEQVVRANRAARSLRANGVHDPHLRDIDNVVFMGMGEPLANYAATWGAVERLHAAMGFSARHVTVSTVGVVPGILRLAGERLPVNLAVSLHAANDDLRNELVPLNRRYPLDVLMDACRAYQSVKGRRLSFEWALIDGVNDRPSDAAELGHLARPLAAHVNLIPLNPTPGYPTRGTPPAGVRAFRDRLWAAGINATIRHNRGTDIAAACGQLAARAATSP
ncbi:MAG: 23S rRNA (adenine(2503)-C(2))-methyltransferase RlmN [Acidimicrobiales bacterium]